MLRLSRVAPRVELAAEVGEAVVDHCLAVHGVSLLWRGRLEDDHVAVVPGLATVRADRRVVAREVGWLFGGDRYGVVMREGVPPGRAATRLVEELRRVKASGAG